MKFLESRLLEKVFLKHTGLSKDTKHKLSLKSNLEIVDSEDVHLIDIQKQIGSVKSKIVFQKIKPKEKPKEVNYANIYFDARQKKWNSRPVDGEEYARLYQNFDKIKHRNEASSDYLTSKSNSVSYLAPCLMKSSRNQEKRIKIKRKLSNKHR